MLEITTRRKAAQTKRIPRAVDTIMDIVDAYYYPEDKKAYTNTRIRINNALSDFIWGDEKANPGEK